MLVSLLQLICEAYHLMKDALGMNADEISEVSSRSPDAVLVCLLMSCFSLSLLPPPPFSSYALSSYAFSFSLFHFLPFISLPSPFFPIPSLPISPLQVFKEWNKGELDSFLIEITANIMAYKVRREYV